jgi:predicted phosphate transport protein (TIGR00153 family)
MLAFRLIPKEEKFFEDFVAMAEQIDRGAALLEQMLAPGQPVWDKADEIKEVEHKCDFLTHAVIQRLHKTFVTPLDREDIHSLARSLDDVIDAIDDSAGVIRLYQIPQVRSDARDLGRIIKASTEQVVSAMKALGKKEGISTAAVEINRLENEADRAHQVALRRLFEEERDAIQIIKWKEVFDFLEAATDRCEDVANVLEGVVVKHA